MREPSGNILNLRDFQIGSLRIFFWKNIKEDLGTFLDKISTIF